MIALMRLPSGRRASTIGDDSSMRRPTCATILFRIRRRCDSSLNLTVVWKSLPSRSIQMSKGPLTMISLTVSSASSRSSGPWPRMSSAMSLVSRSRSARERPLSWVRWRRNVGEHALAQRRRVDADVEELGPEVADHQQMDGVLQLGERVGQLDRPVGRTRRRETFVQIHLCPPCEELRRPRRRSRASARLR